MHLIYTLFIGLIVGFVAKILMPGRDPGGFIITAILGVAGAFVAQIIGAKLHFYQEGQTAGFIASVLGSMLLLFLYRVFIGKAGQE